MPVYIGDRLYPNYPVIDFDATSEQIETMFQDSLTMSNLYLEGLGGDYDGDQVSVKPLYSAEANAEADSIIKAKSNFLAVTGRNTRSSSNEVIQTLYQMTKNY